MTANMVSARKSKKKMLPIDLREDSRPVATSWRGHKVMTANE